mgnify:CR=1 FL=1|tara:strand:+ start:1465 stop:2463 length:999 start_codon:yes stop_codon:yes gene_type:complete
MFDQIPTRYNPFENAFNGSELDFNIQPYNIYLGYEKQEHSYEGVKDIIKTAYNKPSFDKKGIAKYNENGEITDWWVVGEGYHHKSHRDFYTPIWDEILDNFQPAEIGGVNIKFKSARNGRWGMMDLVFPNVGVPVITTNGHETTIKLRIVCWSGLDGSAANNYMLGAIDSFCTNGQVFTQAANKDEAITQLYKRNTSGFDMKDFALSLSNAVDIFQLKAREYQQMADKPLGWEKGSAFIDGLKILSDQKKEGLKILLNKEFSQRGNNIFALHSALTNYSSHNDQLNLDGKWLFQSRKSKDGSNNVDQQMFSREKEVLTIIESKQWQELLVAA